MVHPDPVVMLVPIAPAAGGNGLAMRAGMFLDALALAAPVHVVVVPVSGSADDRRWARARAATVSVVEPVSPGAARAHTVQQVADAGLRDRLRRTAPLPTRAALAPPTLAAAATDALVDGVGRAPTVVAMRLYLAPLGVTLARALGARRVVVDADDDDVTVLRALGADSEAEAYDRLARCWLPDADAVLAASPLDAAAISARCGSLPVDVVPNAVAVPATVPPAPGDDRLLFVGNLTYEPNRAAARLLATDVLPRLLVSHPGVSLDLVGRHDRTLDDLDGVRGVRVTGEVPDVAPFYAAADVVVAPLHTGGGTRIKVLEAFAHRRPVVATATALAGLDVRGADDDGLEVVIAESPGEIASAVDALLRDPERASAMVDRAGDLIDRRYRLDVVAPVVRTAVLGSDAGARRRGPDAA